MQSKKLLKITTIGMNFELIITLAPADLVLLLYYKLLQLNRIEGKPLNRFNR